MENLKVIIESAVKDSFFIGRLDRARWDDHTANRLIYHRILLVEHGTGQLRIDDRCFDINGQDLFLMAKGQLFQFIGSGAITGYLLTFGDCFWEKAPASASNCKAVLFNNAAANQCLKPTLHESTELKVFFRSLLQEFLKPAYTNQLDALAAFLKIIMIKVANVGLTAGSRYDSQDYRLYRTFMDRLSNDYRLYREVRDYADLLQVTPRRLSEVCRRCSGNSAKEIISGQLVAEAKRSLQFSSLPVKEIAYQLNFNSPEQFSHFFKKNTSHSPAGYRDQFVNLGMAE